MMIVLWLALRLAQGRGSWPLLGLAAGAGLETKYTLAVVLALAAGSIPLDRWLTPRRLGIAGAAFVAADLVALPILLPALPLRTAERHGVVSARGDYQSEIGWPGFVRQVEGLAGRADVIVAANYGEAGALELFGRGLPPVASVDVTMRYRRPAVAGRRALLVGYSRRSAGFCAGYRLVGRIATPHGSDERGGPIARCTLDGTLAQVWRRIVATADYTRF